MEIFAPRGRSENFAEFAPVTTPTGSAPLAKRRIAACIPSKSNRKVAIPYDAVLYRQRHKIENMFGRLKDWRRIHTRYDRCAHNLLVGNLYRRSRRLLALINKS